MRPARFWPLPAPAQRAIRTTGGALLTYLIAIALGLPQAVWAVITALVVMQVSVGATIGAGIDRLAGTLGGALVGAAVAVAQPRLGLPDAAALVIAVAPLAAIAAVRPRMRIAPLTAVIILLAAPPDLSAPVAALERIMEIVLGTLVGLAASLLIFPARAHTILRRHAAQALRHLAELTEIHLLGVTAATDEAAVLGTQARMRQAFTAAEACGVEVASERAAHVSDVADSAPVLRSMRRLRSDVALISRTTPVPLPGPVAHRLQPALVGLAAALREAIETLGANLLGEAPPPDLAPVDRAIVAFDSAWTQAELEIDSALRGTTGSKATLALPFAITTLRRDLGDFAGIVEAPPAPAQIGS